MPANWKQLQVAITKGTEGHDVYGILDEILEQKCHIEQFLQMLMKSGLVVQTCHHRELRGWGSKITY